MLFSLNVIIVLTNQASPSSGSVIIAFRVSMEELPPPPGVAPFCVPFDDALYVQGGWCVLGLGC